jgi:hypothetical protein
VTVSPRLRMLATRYALGHTREGLSQPEVIVELLWYLAALTLVGFLASLALLDGQMQVLIGVALASIVVAAKTAEKRPPRSREAFLMGGFLKAHTPPEPKS